MDAGVAAVLGAAVGGLFTLVARSLTIWSTSRSADKTQNALVAATALLMQEDFYHFQVTLARAMDRSGWWDEAEVLTQQTKVSDRKIVWAALSDKSLRSVASGSECLAYVERQSADFHSQTPTTITNAVADAQGWMDYLIQRRNVEMDHLPAKSDFDTMKWTFALLDLARRALQTLANRQATDFSSSHVFEVLKTCHSVEALFASNC